MPDMIIGFYVTLGVFTMWAITVTVMMVQTYRDGRATQWRFNRIMNTGKDLRITAQQEYPELRGNNDSQ